MTSFTTVESRDWISSDAIGQAIERCKLWFGEGGVSCSLVKIPADTDMGRHKHDSWVSVFVIEGTMIVSDADGERTLSAGDFYFVEPGDVHSERTKDAATFLTIKAEPNIQYAVD